MKVKINLTSNNFSLEYLDQTPFIQGSDSRNYLYVLRKAGETPALTDIKVAYQFQNKYSTIAIGGTTDETNTTIDGVSYTKYNFALPSAITSKPGKVQMTIVMVTAASKYKFTVLNDVLDGADFDVFESALEGAASVYAIAMSDLSTEQNIQNTRLTDLEGATGTDTSKISLLNQEAFGDSTGSTSTSHDGLHYIVRTDHEGRIASIEAVNAGARLTTLEGAKLGYIELSSSSGTLTDAQVSQVTLNNCVINYNGRLYKKHYISSSTIVFVAYDMLSQNDTTFNNARYMITITISGSTYSYSATSRSMTAVRVADVKNNLTSTDTDKPLSAAQGKALKDALDELSNYIYQGNANDSIDRLKEVFEFLTGHDDDETLVAILAGKADKSSVYTKTETNTLLNAKADKSTTYTKTETDTLLNAKADKSTTYTKTETDALLGAKANANNVYTKSQTYTKTEVDEKIATLGTVGYEMEYDRMLELFNDAYSDDPVVNALNTLNGEVV